MKQLTLLLYWLTWPFFIIAAIGLSPLPFLCAGAILAVVDLFSLFFTQMPIMFLFKGSIVGCYFLARLHIYFCQIRDVEPLHEII